MKKFLKAVGILLGAVLVLLVGVPDLSVRQLPPDSGQPGT